MNLLDLASKHATYRKHSTAKGGEYVGPCPIPSTCNGAGDDRFHIWPEQDDTGTWWCRICGKGGDAIQFLIEVEGMSYPDACKQLGRELPELQEGRTPQPRRKAADSWQPNAPQGPADKWQEHALKFVTWAHEQFLAAGDAPGSPLAYLAGRGLRRETVVKFRLGWNPGENGKDLYRAREAWGLETVMKGDKKKKLWLPRGLVVPFFIGESLRRVRIRIPEENRTPDFKTPYYIVPGSSMDTFVTQPNARAYFIVEAELDGMLVDQEAGDLTGVMAMGNSSAKPTAGAHEMLQVSVHIANALDYDLRQGSKDNPGGVAWLWWKDHFSQAERWPVPKGKDPGDAFKAGVDIRAWVKAGLPPALTLPKPPPEQPVRRTAAVHQDHPGAGQASPNSGEVHVIRSADGRTVHITDDPDEYGRLVTEKKVVFNSKELALIKTSGANKEQAAKFIDIKQEFPGAKITGNEPLSGAVAEEKTGQGKCYWAK